ncbi:MAG: hypothetical protein GC185_07085 [Alphaproteobacteria bacterium]|nr:hypothetical protein [Alphaproteobacteria bacterium]
MSRMKKELKWLARPVLLHWLLPYLMLLLVAGTVAEKYVGLYNSQRLFFSSFFFWLGGILPVPNVRAVEAALFVSLLAKVIIDSPWKRKTAGSFIAHLAVLTLLLGGVLTALFSTTGFLDLAKGGASSAQFRDYYKKELVITRDGKDFRHVPQARLKPGAEIALEGGATLHVTDACRNCTMKMRPAPDKTNAPARYGLAQKVMLSALPSETTEESNLAGVELFASGTAADGAYLVFEPAVRKPAIFKAGGYEYAARIEKHAYPLPFTLRLEDAKRKLYPGTQKTESYQSIVRLQDGAVDQRALITMNHPLRYKGYTVYQSVFTGAPGKPEVVFAVVRNAGRSFPYIASVFLCLGLLVHLVIKLPGLLKRGENAY